MTLARGAVMASLGAAGAFVVYAWLPHLLAPTFTRRGRSGARAVALTFDDGPDPAWTPRVLDILAAHRARATFFVIGQRAAAAPGIVRAMAAAGHEVGNHSWSHPSLWLCRPRRTHDEIARAHDLIGELTTTPPRYFRPPWGMVNAVMWRTLRRVGERCVLWSIQPEGLRSRGGAEQATYVVARARPGDIVDLHDAEGVAGAPRRLIEALPAMLDGLAEAGYRLTTVSEVLEAAK